PATDARAMGPGDQRTPGRPRLGGVHKGREGLMDFTGQHIVVTGGSSGIGLVTAKMLAQRGAKVSLIARRAELLDQVTREIGPNAAGFPADVGRKIELDQAIEAAEGYFGPITGLFANAGLTGGFTPAVAFDPDVFE